MLMTQDTIYSHVKSKSYKPTMTPPATERPEVLFSYHKTLFVFAEVRAHRRHSREKQHTGHTVPKVNRTEK